jgi:hypothetical protein
VGAAKLSVQRAEVLGQPLARVTHAQIVTLGSLDRRLAGVTITANVPVMIGTSGKRASVMGHLPEPVSTESETRAFVSSLLRHGQIEFEAIGSKKRAAVARVTGAKTLSRETHRVKVVGGKKTLERVRFHCGTRL